jgi:methylmalonyl-CoA/ethylmalonyl-CoA epimerase
MPIGSDGLDFKLLHVGVAVPEIDPAVRTLELLFGYHVVSGPFNDPIQKVAVSFLTRSNDDMVEIEVIAPLTTDSPVRSMLNQNRGGAYHLCFETSDLERALVHVKSQGCLLVSGPAPSTAFGGRRIAWFYAPTRQLFELVEQALI